MTSFLADLKVVVADKDMQATFAGLLARNKSLGIRTLQLDPQSPLVHSGHDPGCWKTGPELLAIGHQHYRHGLLALDWEGSNSKRSADDTRRELQDRLDRLTTPGWGSVVVLQPELEIWVFAGSTEVDRALGWQAGTLNPWLERQGHLQPGQAKPARPKEAVEHAMLEKRKPRSSSVYRQLSQFVGFSRCTDPAFADLKATLQQWFPPEGAS